MRVLIWVLIPLFVSACQGGRESTQEFLSNSSDPTVDLGSRADEDSEKDMSATIYRTEYSIPNIVADDYLGLGYGVGYAQAEDNFCILAAVWVGLEGRAAMYSGRYLGPGRANRDLYQTFVNATVDFDNYLTRPLPHGLTGEALDLVDGYIHGYNDYLAKFGVDGIPDEDCRGQPHIRPITRIDIARRIYDVVGNAGRDLVWQGMVEAEAPGVTSVPSLPNEVPFVGRIPVVSDVIDIINDLVEELTGQIPTRSSNSESEVPPADLILALGKAFADRVEHGGSNGVALGSEATDNGSGMLLANPHWGWDGPLRYWQSHVNIPGERHVSGAGFPGLPMILIGHNESLAWTHTISAARRLALMELQLVPGNSTQYIVDGAVLDMDVIPVTVQVREDDGSLTERSTTFYSTIYGPVTTSILGIDLLPWTQTMAFALHDTIGDSARTVNQFVESNMARTVDELYEVHSKWLGNPFVTTTVADSQGNVLWTDVGAVPNISNEHAALCNTPLGHALWNTFAVAVLRGSLSACEVPTAPDSVTPQTMPAASQPVQKRRDYMTNSNESYWLSNAYEPLEGYSRVFGPERSQRQLRTRLGHRMILERIEGLTEDGQSTFSRSDLQELLFNNRNMLGEMWADDLADACEAAGSFPATPSEAGAEIIDVSEACPVIRNWGKTNTLDDPGAVLFYRFSAQSLVDLEWTLSYIGLPSTPMWRVPFDVNDPVNTPDGLNPAWVTAYTALADTVKEFKERGIPLDATLRKYSRSSYGDPDIPLHGGVGQIGLFNIVDMTWGGDHISMGTPGGTSFVQVTQFFKDGRCPDDRTLLVSSQRSQHAWDRADEQKLLYSRGQWVNPPFCDDELAAAPKESTTYLDNGVITIVD
nr:penicillin acylase family protein [Oceanococcus sp. HetDA_MAG_MS8]